MTSVSIKDQDVAKAVEAGHARQIFMVTGMHRSGTSYLTQTLSLLGLQLPISIQPGQQDNPKGHFESFRITNFHNHLLNYMDLSWDTFVSPPEHWFLSETAQQAMLGLSAFVERDYPGTGPIVLKDPRLCLLLPLWQKLILALGFQGYYIIPLRHPFAVAASLAQRNQISQIRSLLIWLNYTLNAEKFSRGRKRSIIVFPNWVQDIQGSMEKVASDLGIGFPEMSVKALTEARGEFEQTLVHHGESQIDLPDHEVAKLAIDVFNSFKRLAKHELTKHPLHTETLLAIDGYRNTMNEVIGEEFL